MHRDSLIRCVALLLTLCFCAGAVSARPAGQPKCVVELRGSKASLACSTAITAAADASVKQQLRASSAVTWTDDAACGVQAGSCKFTICAVQGNSLLNLQLAVANVTGDPETLLGIVCIAGSTKAAIQVSSMTALGSVKMLSNAQVSPGVHGGQHRNQGPPREVALDQACLGALTWARQAFNLNAWHA